MVYKRRDTPTALGAGQAEPLNPAIDPDLELAPVSEFPSLLNIRRSTRPTCPSDRYGFPSTSTETSFLSTLSTIPIPNTLSGCEA